MRAPFPALVTFRRRCRRRRRHLAARWSTSRPSSTSPVATGRRFRSPADRLVVGRSLSLTISTACVCVQKQPITTDTTTAGTHQPTKKNTVRNKQSLVVYSLLSVICVRVCSSSLHNVSQCPTRRRKKRFEHSARERRRRRQNNRR